MRLFATTPVDEVTVQDIAASVEVTSAAVYYHFGSKEQILTEGMQQFRDELLDVVRRHLPADDHDDGIGALMVATLTWVGDRQDAASVYFVNSIGLNLVVEALRRETRVELVELFRSAVRTTRPGTTAAEAGVIAVALVSLLETSLASMVNEDDVHRGIGSGDFADEVAAIAERITGAST